VTRNTPPDRVSSDGGVWWQVVAGREVVGDKEHPSARVSRRRGWWQVVAGREVVVTRQTPPLAFRATEGVLAGRGGGW